tara:strand:+ start:394 stop:1989 length:1596 start_codon:yes stop_codon:yes gene_type:complete
MSNGEETNEEEVLLEDYLTEDSEDVVEEVPSVNTINPRTAVVDSAFILEEIQTWMIAPMYFFEIGYLSHSTSGSPYDDYVASSEDFYSIQDIMTNSLFSGFLSEDIVTRYNNLITNPTENAQQELAELIGDVGDYLVKGTKQRIQDIDRGGATDGSDAFGKGGVMYPHSIQINFNKKKTRKGNPAFSAEGTPVPYDMVSENVANRNWSEEAKLDEEQSSLEEAEQKAAEASETYVDAEGIVRTSSPAWGYTTDKDGRYTVVTDGESKKKAAPFYKGSEFYLFTDIGPSEIFRLQQQMVRAGMAAPRVDEYGVWSKREANFMAAVFTKATDSGQAEIDIRNNLQGWETTLTNMAEEYSATESFINLLNKTGYGKQTTQNVAPSTIKTMLDLAAASNGVELSARDYTNFAYVVLDALGKQAELEQAFEDSLPSDRDIILGAKFMDVRGIQKGDSYRFFAGNDMPLVLPSMEWLTQSKGGPAPTVINAQDIINEEVGKLKANQVAGNKTLRDIQNVTNLFEQSMLNINYGSESA